MSNPGFHMETDDLTFDIVGDVTHLPDAIRLDDYPCLVYSPDRLGPGVRLEDNGTPIEEIAALAVPYSAVDRVMIVVLAEQFGTTPDHINQAIAYFQATRAT